MELDRSDKPIFVTQPSLPPLEEFIEYLKIIWDKKILTNNGPFHQQLETELASYLGVKYVSLFTNGTLALLTALQDLHISGEVITTPFSFVATTHALWWNNIKPVFVDVEPDYYNLDPEKIEAAITPKTSAILAVHIYGNPCHVERLEEIAKKHNLKLIYDAAHAFGVKIKNNSLLNFGDLSILSFHATKVFNTFEGGAIVCHDQETKKRIDHLKNFGFSDEITVEEPGINAKMNEVQSAMGLLQLKYVDTAIEKRKNLVKLYRVALRNIPGINFLEEIPNVTHNYSYFPIFIEKEIYGKTRDKLYEELKRHNIFGRRYFFPLISQFPMYKDLDSANSNNLSIAEQITEKVICLPLYSELDKETVLKIIRIVKNYSTC